MKPAVGMTIIYDTLTAKHEGTIVGVLDADSEPAVVVIEVGEQKGRTYFYSSLRRWRMTTSSAMAVTHRPRRTTQRVTSGRAAGGIRS